MQNTELRPLGAGEMLDRAITLYVRWFVPIVAVLAVVVVPLTALQAILAPGAARAFSDMARVFSSIGNPAASRQAADAMSLDSGTSPLAVLVVFVGLLLRVPMWNALVAVIAGAYAGTRVPLGAAYRSALRRWPAQLVVALAFLVLGAFASIPVFVVYFIVFLGAVGLTALHQIAAVVVLLIVGGLILLAALCTIGPLVFMAYELASVAVVVETPNPAEAIGIGLRRAFAPGMKRRTIVAGLVLMLVSELGSLPLLGVAAIVTVITRIDALYYAIFAAGSVLIEGIVAAFVVVYAVDVRVRREGYDIIVPADPAPVPA